MLTPAVLHLNDLVTDMVKMLPRLIGEDIAVSTLMASDLGSVKADRGQIEQVIMNLAVNARDAMPEGGKLLIKTSNRTLDQAYARQHAGARPGQYVMLEVADSGMGMDTDTLTHIFEPFFTTKGVGKGTGLGLATVYGVVKQSEGYIWVDSEPGKGASFQVFLPKVSEEKTDELPAATQQRTATISSETILLVEDSDPLRKLTQSFLESSGFRVLVAADGEDALRVARLHPEKIHLLVTDVVMPGINGRVLAERLLAKQHGMKVLFISGYTDSLNAVHGVRERGMALLNKPYTEEELIEGVRKVLNGSSDEIAENRIWNLSERQTQGNG